MKTIRCVANTNDVLHIKVRSKMLLEIEKVLLCDKRSPAKDVPHDIEEFLFPSGKSDGVVEKGYRTDCSANRCWRAH
jgi:hypothetical protein